MFSQQLLESPAMGFVTFPVTCVLCCASMHSTSARPSLTTAQIQDVSSALSTNLDLRLPARLTQEKASDEEKSDYLTALLRHDPGVFLERHGQQLSGSQRLYFQPLREDYEVDFYLKLLEDQDASSSGNVEKESAISSTAKNRRLAKLNRLASEGYFEEEALRKRAPLLHYQYLGKYSKPREPPGVGAAPLHERIMLQHEELQLQSQMAQQQRQEDAAGEAFEATLSESEEASGEDNEEIGCVDGTVDAPETQPAPISAEELEQNRQDLETIMRARFLSGADGGAEADADASLDDDWAKECTQDAEDRYFDS